MFFPNTMLGFGSGGGKATVSFTDSDSDGVDRTTYTFSAKSLGTAASNRKIVVGVSANNANRVVSTLTVGGISATVVLAVKSSNAGAELWQADVPTGATGDIVVTFDAQAQRCGIIVWAVFNAAAAASNTASDTASDPLVATLNIPANGIAIGVANQVSGTNITWTWTNLTEVADFVIGSETASMTGASGEFTERQDARSITADPISGGSTFAVALASFGPR